MQLCAAVAQKIMDECKGNSLMIFTDGAVCGGSVGSGSCAAVLFPLTRAEEVQVETCAQWVAGSVVWTVR